MTRKDYEAIATALGRALRFTGHTSESGPISAEAAAMIYEVTWELAFTNPRFDRDRFIAWVWEVADGKRYEGTGQRIPV